MEATRKLRARMCFAAVAAAAVAVAGCSGSGTSNGGASGNTASGGNGSGMVSPRKGSDTMVLIEGSDPQTLDPVTTNTLILNWIPENVVSPLLEIEQSGKISGGIADSWHVSSDRKTYTFHIRANAKFSNGQPVTPDDVVFSLEQMKGSEYTAQNSPYAHVSSIATAANNSVVVHLAQPSQSFLQGMGLVSGGIMPKSESAEQRATNPIGAGPYKVKSFTAGSTLDLTANPDYWGSKPAIPNMEIRFIADPSAALNAMKAGEADAYPNVDTSLLSIIAQQGLDKQFTLASTELNTMYWVNFNSTTAPFNNPAMRHAVSQAIDRSAYKSIFGNLDALIPTCTYSITTSTSYFKPASKDSCPDAYDPAKAKAALQAAGYSGQPVQVSSITDLPALTAMNEVFVSQLQAAGVNVQRNPLSYDRYTQVVFAGKPPQYAVTVMSTQNSLTQMASCTDPSLAGWKTYCNPTTAQYLADADKATTDSERAADFAKAVKQLQDDAIIVPIMLQRGVALLNPSLKGWAEKVPTAALHLAQLHW